MNTFFDPDFEDAEDAGCKDITWLAAVTTCLQREGPPC